MTNSVTFPFAFLLRLRRFAPLAMVSSLIPCLLVAFSVTAGAQASGSPQSITPVLPRITAKVNDAKRVILKGNTPPMAQARYDRGAVADSTAASRILLVLKRSDEQEKALKQRISDMQNPSSPSYHQWLKPEEFASRYGVADADIAQVLAWLQDKGFSINKVSRGKVAIDFSGTAGQIKSAFHTELHTYVRDGVTFHSNNSDPQIPAALQPVVHGFASLNDIKPKSNSLVLGSAKMNMKTHTAQPQWNFASQCYDASYNIVNCTFYVPAPADLAVQYNLTSTYKGGTTGGGVTIGVISASNVDLSIVKNYRTLFGFSNPSNLPQVIVDGDDPGQNDAAQEAYLDVEASAAMAPDATTNLYVSADTLTTSGLVNAIVRGVDDNTSDVLTLSYGECEQELGASGNQFFYQVWEQAAAQGQSVFVSAGDGGSAGCDNFDQVSQASLGLAVSGFASTPFNTAVGGTDFYYSQWKEGSGGTDLIAQLAASWGASTDTSVNPAASLVAPIQEQPWNAGYGSDIETSSFGYTIAAGSGGASSCASGTGQDDVNGGYTACTAGYPKPAWQAGVGVPADGVRDIPDVSLFASSGSNLSFWPTCAGIYDCRADTTDEGYSVAISGVGGTSASTPAMAGIMALVDQTQKGRQGLANPTLYALAAQFPSTFNDVTVGSNNVNCVNGTPDCSLDTNGDGLYTLQHYSAGAGYDLASGLGSINGANLLANWGKVTYKNTTTTLSLSETTITHGTPVTVKVGVSSSGGTPTGSVALVTTSTVPGQTGQGTIALTDGAGSAAISYLPGGTYSITGNYGGDGVYGSSTSQAATLTVSPEASVVSVSGGALNTTVYPQTLTAIKAGGTFPYSDTLYLDATVAGKSGQGVPTGTVTFLDGLNAIGTANVSSSGVAELVTGTLATGTHSITATYVGDAGFTAGTATAPLAFTVAKADPTIDLLDLGYGSIYTGQPLLVTAYVYGGNNSAPATGTITITMGSLPPQTVTLSPSYRGLEVGQAFATFTPTAPGKYVLTATYSGDSNFVAGTDPYPQNVTVVAPTLAATTTTLTTDKTTVGPNDIFTLTAKVTSSVTGKVPTGYLYFSLGGATYGVILDKTGTGVATIGGAGLGNGVNQVFAQYQGDSTFAVSTSATITINDNQGDFTLTASNPNIVVASGSAGTTTLTVAQMVVNYVNGGLSGSVNFTCTPASAVITCSFNPAALSLLANGAQSSTVLTVNTRTTTATASNSTLTGLSQDVGFGRRAGGIAGTGVAMAALLLLMPAKRRSLTKYLMVILLVGTGFGITACGGNHIVSPTGPTGSNAPAGTYKVAISANASGVQHAMTVNVIVQ